MDVHEGDEVIRVAELFGDVARTLAADDDLDTTLGTIVRLAVENLSHCEHAGISLVEGRLITSGASTSDVPRIVDEIQSEVDEGPCLDAIKEKEMFQTPDLAAESRWPAFSARAHEETGITSVLAVRLFLEEDTMGALNLYSTKRDAFDAADVALGTVFAAHAAVAMSHAHREGRLQRRAESRDVIGRAKGILMARSDCGDDEAFDMLRRASQRLNVKVVEVAADIATRYDADRAAGGAGEPATTG